MRIVGSLGCATGFHLDGDDLPAALHQIIRFAGQPKFGIVQGLIDLAPTARISIDHASARKTGLLPLPIRLPEEEQGEE